MSSLFVVRIEPQYSSAEINGLCRLTLEKHAIRRAVQGPYVS